MNDAEKKQVIDEAAKLHRYGANLELLLVFMRKKGFDQIDSIIALRRVMGFSLDDAKSLVNRSKTWSDQCEKVQALHQTALEALLELIRENDPSLPSIKIDMEQ
jgi:ribosomal protein L7/L12